MMLETAGILCCDLALKMYGWVGIIKPGTMFGSKLGSHPPGCLKFSATIARVSLSKSTKSPGVMIPSFVNWSTVLWGMPIWSAFIKNAMTWAAIKTITWTLFFG